VDAHGHVETLALREQFNTAAQQKDASTLGMWIFLITEIMFFGGMFLVYTVYRSAYPEVFAEASRSLNVYIGAANTVVLLCSSLTMVLAVRATQLGQQKMIVLFLILTLILGFVFLGVKAFEWHEKFV
jgi:cytochrome c oxidase subunit 3